MSLRPDPHALQRLTGEAAPPAAQAAAGRQPIDSRELLRGGRVIEIAHEGTVYRLQATRLGKLILTK